MTLLLKRKNRTFEVVKKAIKLEGFKDAIEARQIAVLRGVAMSRIQEVEPTPELALVDARASESAEEEAAAPDRSVHKDDTAEPMSVDREFEAAPASRASPSKEAHQVARGEQKQLKSDKLAERRLERARQRAQEAAVRGEQWAAAEGQRKERLKRLSEEKTECMEQREQVEADLKLLQSELEKMNKEKADLVLQLKQVLQHEDTSKIRMPTASSNDDSILGGQELLLH